MIIKKSRKETRRKRQLRIRKKIKGTASVPRLNVFRSNAHIYAQLIDDTRGVTLASASSLDKEFKELNLKNGSNIEAAKAVGTLIAKRALAMNIDTVVFDRGGFLYHGRVKALAEAAREAGLKF
ncbi:MAG: 50S ribosomal protein L18 [Acholeplasmataceae bacterium]|nr:50S ribosomal protein L18 [Acholeplasmataceae bacterium]HOA63269.1 50S ribosomal protein L18 [Bacilli bacterium]HPT88769.1 50S ribosomal protein L18 [Bacilli bacterium]HQA19301.1 50S ribosomal protein L18 [Bacilli bacterium]HQD91924.1 50S ribosomal protein L18 [Bacilli bacterium]